MKVSLLANRSAVTVVKRVGLGLCFALLSACARMETPVQALHLDGKALPELSVDATTLDRIAYRRHALHRLAAADVQVMRVGEIVRVTVPTDHIFKHKTTNFKDYPTYQYFFDDLTKFLNSYHKTTVKIRALHRIAKPNRVAQALVASQAEAFAQVLDQNGLDARFVVAHGKQISSLQNNATYPVSDRIEIIFWSHE